jgi:hypothetical protein
MGVNVEIPITVRCDNVAALLMTKIQVLACTVNKLIHAITLFVNDNIAYLFTKNKQGNLS